MPSPPCFIANWKMNKGIKETETYLSDLIKRCSRLSAATSELIIAPPFIALDVASVVLKRTPSAIGLAAQNVHSEKSGAYTGEISSGMLCEIGCDYVIIGHSERRSLFGETDERVGRKLRSVRNAGLRPILCIGETHEDRRSGKTWKRLSEQLATALGDGETEQSLSDPASDWLVAYEPVWAIGTGETPKPSEVASLHQQIRTFVDQAGKGTPRILYGGSVSEKNISDFMKETQIDGVLVGGASLSAETFFKIVALGTDAKKCAKG